MQQCILTLATTFWESTLGREPYSECTWNSPSDPGSCDDGADDDNGHGTHVAGSVLGDGTASSGSVMGIAPEAQLLVHAFEQNGGLGGIPNDYQDFFDVAVENNSRIHTNSWGSCNRPNKHAPCNDYGLYSTGSMQIDMGALTHKQLVILFANGNDAEDGDGNGEIDDNSTVVGSNSQKFNLNRCIRKLSAI